MFVPFAPIPVKADRVPEEYTPFFTPQQEITEPQNSSQDMFASPLCTELLKSCSAFMELSSPARFLKLMEIPVIVT